MRCVISVLGKDRTGIVAAVATTLTEKGVTIDDINQALLEDMFSMTMLVRIDEAVAGFNEVQDALAKVGEELGVQVVIQREDLFQFMYKI